MRKNVYGVTGYPTPDATTERICRTFQIPNSTLALGAFMGALWPLASPEAWQEYGDMTPIEAAAMMQDILWTVMLAEDVCAIAETPYWDTAANVDDTLPEGSETWYGEIVETPALLGSGELTFLDNLGIWAIAGFIAYSGQVGAAIAFVPVAQRFVLAFKQHDLGGIIKVLIDFAEVAEIDTYGVSEAIQSLNVVMPDDGEIHTLYVMMSDTVNPAVVGDPFIQVVRKELTPSQVTPTTLRWNPDTNTVQQTPDGGTTWIDNPSADPRNGTGFQLPPRGGDDPRCDATINMLAKLMSITNIFEAEIAQVQAANAFVDIVLVFLPEVGIVIEALLAATEFLLTIGADVIASAFTDAQWDIVKCILYCDIAADGTVNDAQFNQILVDIHDKCSTIVYDVLYTILHFALDKVGLSNAGATGSETGDCSGCDCGWCYEYDFTASNGGFTANVSGSLVEGTYVGGIGWQEVIQNDACTSHGYLAVYTDLSSGNLANLEVVQIFYMETNHDGTTYFIDQDDSTGSILTRTSWATYTTAGDSFSVVGNASATRLAIIAFPCGQTPGNPATLYKLKLMGHGIMPAFTGGEICP